MAESRISFLYKAASMLSAANTNKTLEKLKSYYRMRCKEISKGCSLPSKHFSEQILCTHCGQEWKRGAAIKVNSINLSKRQRKRINSKKSGNQANKKHLLHSNEIEQTCTFCGHSTKTVALKPRKSTETKLQQPIEVSKVVPQNSNKNQKSKKNQENNVYNTTQQVFSLNNNKNNLNRVEEPKIIKNNKKKKDKFAGLCQRAVLMSAKLKQVKDKQNKLNLFLKPSS